MLGSPTVLFDQTVTGVVNGAEVSPPIPEGASTASLAAAIIITNATVTTMDVRVMHSPDGGTTWFELIDFTQVTADGSELVTVATPFFGMLRVEVDTFTGTTADVKVIVQ